MQESVDKQIEEMFVRRVSVCRSFAMRNIRAQDHLAALTSDFVREHVRHILFVTQHDIKTLRPPAPGNDE